jgi:hypothetical protein
MDADNLPVVTGAVNQLFYLKTCLATASNFSRPAVFRIYGRIPNEKKATELFL